MFHQNKCPTQKNNCIHVSTKTSWTKDVSTWKPFFPSTMKINQGHWFTGPPATSLRPLRWTLVAPQWNSGRGTNIDPATGTCGTCSTCFHLANKFRNSMIEVKTGLQIMHCRTYYVHRILPVCIWSHAKVPRGEVPLYNRIKNTRSWELLGVRSGFAHLPQHHHADAVCAVPLFGLGQTQHICDCPCRPITVSVWFVNDRLAVHTI